MSNKIHGLTKTEVKLEIGQALACRKQAVLPSGWTIDKLVTVFWSLLVYIDPCTLWRVSNAYPFISGTSGGQHGLKGLIGSKREKNALTWLGLVEGIATWNDRASPELENLLKKASPESWKVIAKRRGYALLGEVYFLSLGRHLTYSNDGRLKTSGHMGTSPEFTAICNLVANGGERRTTQLEDGVVTSGMMKKSALLENKFSDSELVKLLGLDTIDSDEKALKKATTRAPRKAGRKSA